MIDYIKMALMMGVIIAVFVLGGLYMENVTN